jgi:RecA-family ATPase
VTARTELLDYFEQLYQDTEGLVYAPVKGMNGFRKFMIPWPAKKEQLVAHVLKWAADETAEVFYSPALFKDRQPTQEGVLGSWYAWAEFDGNFPTPWPIDIAPLPSIEIQSSIPTKRHVYWALVEFTERKQLEELNRSLAYALGADLSGWDANQFLRPPHSVHRKGKPIPVKLLHNRLDRIYEHSDFSTVPVPKEAIRTSLALNELPDIEEVLAEAKWDKELLELFRATGEEMQHAGRDRSGALQRLAYEGAEHGWADGQIMAVLIDADDRWQKYTNRTERARQKILVDLINRARAKVGYTAESELVDLAKALGVVKKVEDPDDDQVLFSIQELASLKGIEDWIVEDLLTPRGLGLFTGRPGVGKTQLGFQLSADIASGRKEFLGRSIDGTGSQVLFLSLEMNKYQLPHIAKPVFERYPDLDQRKLAVYAKGEMLPLDQESGQAYLEALLERIRPKVVIIDSLSHMASAELTSDTEMKAAFEFLQRARNEYDFGLIIIHHHRKKANDAASRKQPDSLSDVYGSFYITAAVDFVLNLEVIGNDAEEGTITMSMLKSRYSAIPEPVKVVRNNKLHFDIADDLITKFTERGDDDDNPSLGL